MTAGCFYQLVEWQGSIVRARAGILKAHKNGDVAGGCRPAGSDSISKDGERLPRQWRIGSEVGSNIHLFHIWENPVSNVQWMVHNSMIPPILQAHHVKTHRTLQQFWSWEFSRLSA